VATTMRTLVSGIVLAAIVPFVACSASDKGSRVRGSGGDGGTSSTTGGTGAVSITGGGGNVSLDGGGTTGTGGSSGAPVVEQCPGPLDAGLAAALAAGGPVDPQMRWLYPYDKTVFPRGMTPPVFQWAPAGGAPPTAVYVRLHTQGWEYKGCFGPVNPARLQLPQDIWDQATTAANGVANPLIVELTTAVNGVVSGPIVETWAIAPATLKGVVFYNTYNSPQVQNNGAVMRMIPGQAPQPYLTQTGLAPLGPCVSCHALSAHGQHLVAETHTYPAGPYISASYPVGPTANPAQIAPLDAAGFGGVFPDGSRVMTSGSPGTTIPFPFPLGPGNLPGMEGPRLSRLFNMANGQDMAPAGWTVQHAKMPMFSPDGTKLVFNHHEASDGHSLAVMDYNAATNTFSNLVPIYSNPQLYPGWPFFTPDNKGVVFVLGDAADYVSAHPARPIVARSDLYYVDIATKQAVRLSRAGGYEGSQVYLPYPGRDERYEFFPTVSPVAAGGYFWAFFTSRRNYGNSIVTPGAEDVATKKIWVTAIDIDAPPGSDPSHPAFYLPGQEEPSGNVRAFAALEPCKDDGAQCATGIECCCGGCLDGGVCGCPVGCSKIDEKCTTAADCCEPSAACLGGFCAFIIPK
jgi:hypothetical protein